MYVPMYIYVLCTRTTLDETRIVDARTVTEGCAVYQGGLARLNIVLCTSYEVLCTYVRVSMCFVPRTKYYVHMYLYYVITPYLCLVQVVHIICVHVQYKYETTQFTSVIAHSKWYATQYTVPMYMYICTSM